jgi:hypothetical protein
VLVNFVDAGTRVHFGSPTREAVQALAVDAKRRNTGKPKESWPL